MHPVNVVHSAEEFGDFDLLRLLLNCPPSIKDASMVRDLHSRCLS